MAYYVPVNPGRGPGNPAVLNTMREALERLGRSGKEISDDLVVKNDIVQLLILLHFNG